jgi:hypothetical protein
MFVGICLITRPARAPGWYAPDPSTGSGTAGGTAVPLRAQALRAVKPFSWREVGSDKLALSRPGRAPGWYPILPTSPLQGTTQYPYGA